MINPYKTESKINPQRDDGNRQLSNEVFRELIKVDLTGAEYKIALAVIDKTWGYNKSADAISVSQFMSMTGLSERTVRLVIKSLKEKQIIHYEPSDQPDHTVKGTPLNVFLFNKHHDTWKGCKVEQGCKPVQGCKELQGCKRMSGRGAKVGISGVNQIAPTKERTTKEITTKEREGRPPCPIQFLQNSYNTHCTRLSACRAMSPVRIKSLQKRWRDHPSEQWWIEYFKRINLSDFMAGDNDRGWVADFDFVINPQKMVRILEGKYDNRKDNKISKDADRDADTIKSWLAKRRNFGGGDPDDQNGVSDDPDLGEKPIGMAFAVG